MRGVGPDPAPERHSRGAAELLLIGLLSCLAGCTQAHYLVRTPELPLYGSPLGDEVVALLPRFHHEALQLEDDPSSPRVALSYRGQAGFAPRQGLALFDYLDPALDEGEDRERVLRQQLRGAQVDAFGKEWEPSLAQAVREGRVMRGMTSHQVEVSWGWPSQVEPGPTGEQRWIYERRGTQIRQVYRPGLSWSGSHPLLGPAWGPSSGWVMTRERFLERRILTIDAAGQVARIQVLRSEN